MRVRTYSKGMQGTRHLNEQGFNPDFMITFRSFVILGESPIYIKDLVRLCYNLREFNKTKSHTNPQVDKYVAEVRQ